MKTSSSKFKKKIRPMLVILATIITTGTLFYFWPKQTIILIVVLGVIVFEEVMKMEIPPWKNKTDN